MQKSLIILLLLAAITACSTSPPTAQTAGMVQLNATLYVDPAMSMLRREQLLTDIARSKQTIAHFFGGELHSEPMIYACVTNSCFQKFSEVHPYIEAKALGDTTILLAEAGCNETIITHEMTHIELHKRLGKHTNLHRIPMWFDEGLAILACQDPRYMQDVPLFLGDVRKNLRTERQWLFAVSQHQKPYQQSYQAVKQWHANVGTQGLLQTIEHMKQTGRFSLRPEVKYPISNKIVLH